MRVERLRARGIVDVLPALVPMLRACVDEGAGLGFLPGVSEAEAEAYWRGLASDITVGTRVLLVARDDDGRVVGTAQLELCPRPNGLHRAEAQKVMVAPDARRAGVGSALMRAVDAEARAERRTLLHLDTFAHQGARGLYERCGWRHAGDIPEFARDASGALAATSVYYKLLARA